MLIPWQFIRSGCEFFETTGYLNPSECTTLKYIVLKATTGYLENFHLGEEPEPGSVRAPVEDPVTSHLPDQAIAGSAIFFLYSPLMSTVFSLTFSD